MNLKKLLKSFKYAFEGIISAIKCEQNMKIHVLAMILVIIAGFFFKISLIEWMFCVILFGVVIGIEMVNTAIEKTVDLACPQINEKAKIAKDVAAGAVLVIAICAAIVAFMIFIPKIIVFLA